MRENMAMASESGHAM